ncbi:substrate-binding domain-containing protein [Pseudonocardia sp. NPDC049635]|uniref:substrate-binding domain-containing protein n=1 Tax=Pseudonocardia sp. NPDC049635 TaxID=3155506 RepID=UPI00340E9BAC
MGHAGDGGGTTFTVALVIPFAGSEALYGPSCLLCAQLAAEEINAEGGILGRPVRMIVVDGGAGPSRVADEVGSLVDAGRVDAVVGWHTSAVRQRLAPRLRSRVPYVFTALYEGGETTPGVFAIGETPEIQLYPALRWMAEEIGVRRWFVVGNDYVWPRRSTELTCRFLHECGAPPLDGVEFLELGTVDFGPVLRRIESGSCDGVLMLLVGRDAVEFNRQFARRGLEDRCARFSPLMDESMLTQIGARASRDVFTAAGYFESLPTAESLGFGARYVRRFGPDAPVLNAPGESCYDGVRVLAELIERAGTAEVGPLTEAADRSCHDGPRGTVRVTGARTEQRIYLATADGADYDILASI